MSLVKLARFGCALACLFASQVFAGTTTFDFTGNGPATMQTGTNAGYNYVYTVQSLLNSGSATIPSYDVHVGDVLNGTVTLAQPFVVLPSTAYVSVGLPLGGCCIAGSIQGYETFTFFDQGNVVASTGFSGLYFYQTYSILAATAGANSTSGFTFDSMTFSLDVTALLDNSGAALSVIHQPGGPALIGSTSYVSAVPEPASWVLLLAGVGVLVGLRRKKSSR